MSNTTDRLNEIFENIESDRKMLQEAARDLKSKIKDLSEHAIGGTVLSRYLETLSKINQQLIDIEKLKIKQEIRDKTKIKNSIDDVHSEIEADNSIGTTLNKSN